MIKVNLLKAKQAFNGVNNKTIAAKTGISEQQLSKKLNNKVSMNTDEAVNIANAIGMTKTEFLDIFFSNSFAE